MAANLIEMFKNTVGDLMVNQASGSLGESAESTKVAVDSIVSSILGVLMQKGGTDAGAKVLLDYITENKMDGSLLSNASNLLGGGPETENLKAGGAGILKYLIGDKLGSAVDIISGGSGLKTSSASSLLKFAAPMVMGVLGKYVREKSSDAPGLKTLLLGQREFVKAGIPAQMSELFGLGALLETSHDVSANSSNSGDDKTSQTNLSKLLPWIVLLLSALGLFYFVQNGCGAKAAGPDEPKEAPKDTVKATTPLVLTRVFTLPGGGTLNVLPESFTGMLATHLESADDADKCISFDQVNFETGSSSITATSQQQLEHLAILLKAYPKVKLRIEGHTDNVGDAGKNKSLSKDRAKAIKSWLVDHEIAPGRIDTKGWGSEKPIASTDDEAGLAKNRRMEVCVVKK